MNKYFYYASAWDIILYANPRKKKEIQKQITKQCNVSEFTYRRWLADRKIPYKHHRTIKKILAPIYAKKFDLSPEQVIVIVK